MPSWPREYRYDPCDRCGRATRFKQFPLVCACTTPDRCPHPPFYVRGNNICQRCGGDPRVPRRPTPKPASPPRTCAMYAETTPTRRSPARARR
jgi:hypothetical protein